MVNKMARSNALVIAIVALILAILGLVAIAVGYPLIVLGNAAQKTFLQSGNVTFQLSSPNIVDSVTSTYRLYQGASDYLLELDVPARELMVPNGVVTSAPNVQVLIRYFSPPIEVLATYGWYEYIFQLSQPSIALIVVDGTCYDPPNPNCIISAVPSNIGTAAKNSFLVALDIADGILTFYMKTIDSSYIDWSNYTLGLAGTLRLTFFSA